MPPELNSKLKMIDLSHPVSPDTPPFPGDPPVEIDILDAIDPAASGNESGQDARRHLNCSRLSICIHCGTHMDAPFHFFADGRTMDQVPLELCVGPALLVDLREAAPKMTIEPSHLTKYREQLKSIPRVIFRTNWFQRWQSTDYFTDHPVLNGATARLLVECGVKLVGVDFPSVDHPPFPAHLELLGNGVVIVENLTNLDQINTPVFRLVAMPLRLSGRDGSPVRALAIIED